MESIILDDYFIVTIRYIYIMQWVDTSNINDNIYNNKS